MINEKMEKNSYNYNINYNNLYSLGDFSEIEIPNADLIFANMSLFFVKDNFEHFLEKILSKINNKGFFVANFLGKEDDWNGSKTTIEKEK